MIKTGVSLILILVFIGSSIGIGRLLLRSVGSWASALERAIFCCAVGMGAISFLVLLVGVLGLFPPPGYWILVLSLLSVFGSYTFVTLWREKPAKGRPRFSTLELSCIIAFAGLGLFTLIGALAPPGGNEWDALSYHLAVPKIYLREGRIFYIPWVSHSNFPFVLQMLYTLMLGLGSVGAAKLCHWLCGVLLVLSVYTFAARHVTPAPRGKQVGLIAALIVAATPIVLWEASVAYVDLATALFTWLSLYALFNAAQAVEIAQPAPPARPHPLPLSRSGRGVPATAAAPASHESKENLAGREAGGGNATGSPLPPRSGKLGEHLGRPSVGVRAKIGADSLPWLVVSAVLMGLALGTKYTVLGFWGMLLVGVLGWYFVTTGRWAKATLPHTLLWGGVSLLVAAPWYVKTWVYTGNPVYPFFYGLFGGRYWNAANAAQYTAAQAQFGFGKGAVNFLLAPWQTTMEASLLTPQKPILFTEYVLFGLSPVYVAVLLAAPLFVRRLSRVSVLLCLFAAGVFVFWFFLMQQTRYLIPALPALAIICGEVLVTAWEELRIARWFGAGLAAASVAWGLYLGAVYIAAPALPVVTGQMTTQAHVARTLPGLASAVEFINRETPKEAKVALFDEVRGFYLDRDYLWATPNHSTLLPWNDYKSVDDWLSDFRGRGYTTLLVNARNVSAAQDGQTWRRLLPEAIAENKVTIAFQAGDFVVYRIP